MCVALPPVLKRRLLRTGVAALATSAEGWSKGPLFVRLSVLSGRAMFAAVVVLPPTVAATSGGVPGPSRDAIREAQVRQFPPHGEDWSDDESHNPERLVPPYPETPDLGEQKDLGLPDDPITINSKSYRRARTY